MVHYQLHDQPPSQHNPPRKEPASLDDQVAELRAQVLNSPGNEATAALATAIRRRFFRPGNPNDLNEALCLMDIIPPATLESIGTAGIELHPELERPEHTWVRWQPWLESQGYILASARYRPGWTPSWTIPPATERDQYSKADAFGTMVRCPDKVYLLVIDARRRMHISCTLYVLRTTLRCS